jgi:GNAT superfamily N-acetyltransferase
MLDDNEYLADFYTRKSERGKGMARALANVVAKHSRKKKFDIGGIYYDYFVKCLKKKQS